MKRPILVLVAAGVFVTMASCSLNAIRLPTPFPTTPGTTLPASTTLSSTALASPSPVPATPTLNLPSPTATLAAASTTAPAPTIAATTSSPVLPQGPSPTASTPYAVILIDPGDSLNIRSGPGAENALVGTFPAAATDVMRVGPSTTIGGDAWVVVQAPAGGKGWVNARYLTEYVPKAAFCADSRVNALLAALAHALTASDGAQLAGLVSTAHGMDVRLYRYGTVVNYDPAHARYVFDSSYAVDWGPAPGSGQETVGAFHVAVLPGLQEETGGASYDASWPERVANVNFYSVYKPGPSGQEQSWRTVLVGVEYVAGQPYVFSLTQMTWEP